MGAQVLIKKITLRDHPIFGDLHLDFSDANQTPFPIVIFAGGNGCGKTALLETIHRIFEWHPSPNLGKFSLELALDSGNIEQLDYRELLRSSDPIDRITISYEKKYNNNNDWVFEFGNATQMVVSTDYGIVSNRIGKTIFRSFLTEANVAFHTQRVSAITSLELDQEEQASTRSGNDLAQQVTQLLIDIRAADAEDLQRWVEENKGIPAPEHLLNRRMKRFTDAFHYMFPKKRFKTISRVENALEVQFQEHGNTTNINQLSTGEKQVVFRGGFVLKNLSQVQGGLLLIDEPELSLHPEWQSRILGFYQRLVPATDKLSTQILVATHSPFIIHDAPRAKTIVLERNPSGAIQEMRQPTYPTAGSNLGIVAFNIDSFIASAKYNLLVIVEGDTDTSILETAWAKLHPDETRFFEIRSAIGAKNISITLNDSQLFAKSTHQKIVGLLDFDDAYNQWNGIWKKQHSAAVTVEADCLTRRHSIGPAWAMLLPVPIHRSGFASSTLGGESILSIEFLFSDADIPVDCIGKKAKPMNSEVPYIRQNKKADFSEHVKNLPSESFSAFEPIFLRWREIAAGML